MFKNFVLNSFPILDVKLKQLKIKYVLHNNQD
jgi:hypothetical protein